MELAIIYMFCIVSSSYIAAQKEIYDGNENVENLNDEIPAPADLTATTINSTAILVTWSQPDSNHTIEYYDIEWDGAGINGQDFAYNTSYIINDLKACSEYDIRVAAFTADDNSDFANTFGSTGEEEPGPVMNLTCYTVSYSEISVTWSEPSSPCDLTGYTLSYYGKTILYNDTDRNAIELALSCHSYNLENLMSYSDYYIFVNASNNEGSSEAASTSCQTEEGVSDPPTNITTSLLPPTSLGVSWTPPERINGILKNYWVSYSSIQITGIQKIEPNETSTVIEDLEGCTQYSFLIEVWAENGAQNGTHANENALVDTEGTAPYPPEALTCTTNSANTITVSWNGPDFGCPLNGYNMSYNGSSFYGDIDEATKTLSANDSSAILTGLMSFSFYKIELFSYNDLGESDAIETTCLTDEGVPEAPTDVNGETISTSSIEVFWTPPERVNGILKHYWVTYNISSNETESIKTEADETSSVIDQLSDCSLYTVTVRAENGAQNGTESEPANVPTASEGEATPTSQQCSPTSYQACTNWTKEAIFCPVEMEIRWEGTILWIDESNNTVYGNDSVINDNYYCLESYVAYTEYEICIGEQSSEMCCSTTTEEDVPGNPCNIQVTSSGSDAQITWEEPQVRNGIITGYSIEWETNDQMDSDDVDADTYSYNVSNLVSCSDYQISVSASTSAGEGTPGIAVFTSDSTDPPDQVDCSCGLSSVNVTFVNPADCDPPDYYLSQYLASYKWSDDTEGGQTKINSAAMKFQLEDPIPYATYNVCLSGDPNPPVEKTECCTCDTPEDEPSAPQNFVTSTVEDTSISMEWDQPEYLNGVLRTYTVNTYLDSTSEQINTENTTETEYTAYNLVEDTRYTFRVTATTGGGRGPPAELTATTLIVPATTLIVPATTIIVTATTIIEGNDDDDDDDANVGAIVGVTLGSLALLVVIGFGVGYGVKRKQAVSKMSEENAFDGGSQNTKTMNAISKSLSEILSKLKKKPDDTPSQNLDEE